jgi:UDP-2-acetamido-3-amino-2,3-dideoxy-glucuronate N-acetyltransferase
MNNQNSSLSSHPTLALVGAGYWGKNLARNFHSLGVLHTLCDSDPATLAAYDGQYAAVRQTLSFEETLRQAEIAQVAIAAPAALHYELARAALAAGKDVFVEKPLCLDVRQGRELVEMAGRSHRVLMVGHLLQYHPLIQALQALVAQGELGKLQYLTSNRLNLGKFRREENALWSFAPHDLSVLLSLAGGGVPEQVQCLGAEYLNRGIADSTLTFLRFAGDIRAHVYVSWLNPFKEQKLTVVGSHGMAVFDDTLPWPEKLLLYRHHLTWTNGQIPTPNKAKAEPVLVPEAEPLRCECEHFLACCRDRRPPRTDGAEGLRVLQVLHAAQRSLETRGEEVAPGTLNSCGAEVRADYTAHPTAVIDAGARIGSGTRVWHFSHIMKGAQIGRGCSLGQNVNVDGGVLIGDGVKIQNNVSVYTGTIIEADVFLGPSCVLTNVTNPRAQINRHALYEKTLLRRGATVGANATLLCGITLGRYCFVGAGAVVTDDVPDYALVVGNPARQIGWMSRHGHILKHTDDRGLLVCPESGFRYRLSDQGTLRCVDLAEEAPLPPDLSTGKRPYADWKQAPAPAASAAPGRSNGRPKPGRPRHSARPVATR